MWLDQKTNHHLNNFDAWRNVGHWGWPTCHTFSCSYWWLRQRGSNYVQNILQWLDANTGIRVVLSLHTHCIGQFSTSRRYIYWSLLQALENRTTHAFDRKLACTWADATSTQGTPTTSWIIICSPSLPWDSYLFFFTDILQHCTKIAGCVKPILSPTAYR